MARGRSSRRGGSPRRPNKRRGSRGSGARSLLRGSQRAPRRPSIRSKLHATERAIKTLGESKVRKGPKPLGSTRKITPTKAGFRVVGRVLKEINKVSRVGKRRVFTYDLKGSYIGPDGKRRRFTRKGIGIPRPSDVRRRKGESLTAAMNRVVQNRITGEVQTILRERLKGETPPGKFKGRPITRKAAAKALRKFKKTRGVKFSVTFNREV